MKKVKNRMNNEGSIAQRGVESLVALFSHIHWCPQLCGVLAITMYHYVGCGKVQVLTPKETREGVDSHTKTDICRSVSRNLFMHSHKRYLYEQM